MKTSLVFHWYMSWSSRLLNLMCCFHFERSFNMSRTYKLNYSFVISYFHSVVLTCILDNFEPCEFPIHGQGWRPVAVMKTWSRPSLTNVYWHKPGATMDAGDPLSSWKRCALCCPGTHGVAEETGITGWMIVDGDKVVKDKGCDSLRVFSKGTWSRPDRKASPRKWWLNSYLTWRGKCTWFRQKAQNLLRSCGWNKLESGESKERFSAGQRHRLRCT